MEREHRLYQEEQLKLREQAERERQAALAAKEEAERTRLNYEREERERRLREKEEHKHQEEERRSKREREQRERDQRERDQRERDQREKRERDEIEKRSQHSSGWLGKRTHQESGSSGSGYSSVKRPALHGSSDSYGTVFSRLDPQTQQKKIESNIQPLMSTHVDTFRRPSDHRSGHSSGNVYAKAMSGGLAPTVRSAPATTDLSPELLSAATQALENLRKSVHGVGSIGTQLSLPKPMPHLNVMSAHAQLQQLAASNASALSAASGASRIPVSSMLPGMNSRSSLDVHQQAGSMMRQPALGSQGSGSGGIGTSAFSSLHGKSSGHYGGGSGGGVNKLPPEEERYNRRFGGGRSSHHQSGGRPGYKGRMN